MNNTTVISTIVRLNNNENALGASKFALKAAEVAAVEQISRYPDSNATYLKERLSEKLQVSPKQLILGNGSSEILEIIVRAFADANAEIIISQHAFAIYALMARSVGATAVITPTLNWGDDLENMLTVVTKKTKLIFIANPNNPTGSYISFSELAEFIDRIPESIIVVVDEAYFEYVMEENYSSVVCLVKQHTNLIVIRSFSKVYGLAGLRIGYAIASQDIVSLLRRSRQPYSVNVIAIAAATAALEDESHIIRSRLSNQFGLQQLTVAISDLNLEFISSRANFLTVNFGYHSRTVYRELQNKSILICPLSNYQMPGFMRITIGTDEQNTFLITTLNNLKAAKKF
jgi:histidinol-phosphate aminotransferase